MGEKEVEGLMKAWGRFADSQEGDGAFMLNPDRSRVRMLANGVLDNEKSHGLKYCPCRMRTGDREADLRLICPCNFKAQHTWRERGECWCSLFVRRK